MLKKLISFIALLGATTTAQAEAVQIAYLGGDQTVSTSITVSGKSFSSPLGSYFIQPAGGAKFEGFCVDPFQWATSSFQTYDRSSLDPSDFLTDGASRFNNVQKLFDNAYSSTFSTNTKAAGFHLALWEIFRDDGNLNTGNVMTNTNSNSSVISEANLLLGSLSNWNVLSKYNYNFYYSGQYQDFLSVNEKPSAVPIPAALPLMASAIGVVGIIRRRKKQ